MKFTQDQIDDICVSRLAGQSVSEISGRYATSWWAIGQILGKNQIKTGTTMTMATITKEQKDNIISLYKDGYSTTTIGKSIGMSYEFIRNVLEKYSDIDHSLVARVRKYKSINEHYFDTIDSEDKAYFLGLLYADGCIDKRAIILLLIDSERDILTRMSNLILGETNLKFRKAALPNHSDTYTLRISNKFMVNKLISLGCTRRKSLTLRWPEWLVDPDLQRHFIRGYFDGDGCLTLGARQKAYKFSIVSTFEFCQRVDQVINSQLPTHFYYDRKSSTNGITTTLATGGNRQIERLMDWIYKDASYYIQRKYNKHLELKHRLVDIDKRALSTERHINQYY